LKLTQHPLHPALAHFPVAFWSASAATDAAALFTGDGAWWLWSHRALTAGLVMAVLALLAGVGEALLRRIPRQASQTLILHISSMLTAFACFLASLALRKHMPPSTLALSLSGLGLAALLIGGWFGGTLVYHFGIGTAFRAADRHGDRNSKDQ
jgi:uncharacterized membrane protein